MDVPRLQLKSVTKRFGDVLAVDDVSIDHFAHDERRVRAAELG
jgi:hypothetical protein